MKMDLLKRPRVLEKMRNFERTVRKTGSVGVMPRGFFINCDNRCNFSCKQCFTMSPECGDSAVIPVSVIKRLAVEADELGMYEIVLEGGEPLVDPNLFEIINAFGSDRFYLGITTNGYCLDEKMASRLAEAGVSRVVVSLDGMDSATHDSFRGVDGAFDRAIKALENVKKTGMRPSVNFLVGHYNARTSVVEEMCDFCAKRGYQIGLISASAPGNWKGKLEVLLDADDTKRLNDLRMVYSNMWRDLWPPIDNTRGRISGCLAVNRPYITPNGDVLPCSYIHVKIGNIYENSLKEILEYGFTIKYFREHSDVCFTGEDVCFVQKYLQKENMSMLNPPEARDVFFEDDFVGRDDSSNE
jgi:MoaA/NifB/PqqE/SkfB family radical SAM enzyme